MRKRAVRLGGLLLVAVIVLGGCMNQLKSKTIIVDDTEENKKSSAVKADFEVNKIYKISGNENILGWLDNDHILGDSGRNDQELRLESIEYQYNSRQKQMSVNKDMEAGDLSPDGLQLCVASNEHEKQIIKLIGLKDHKETLIGEIGNDQLRMGAIVWSSSSRYISFAKKDRSKTEARIVVYDVNLHSSKEYVFTQLKGGFVSYVKVSDDGESALAVILREGQDDIITVGALKENEFISQYEHEARRDGNFDFMNNDQVVFVGQNGSLTLYDRRNETATTLAEQVSTFGLSNDRKYIAYSKDRENMYVASLQGNRLLNEQVSYKGRNFYQMYWSPDAKKILITGIKSYGTRPGVVSAQENVPLVIEFK
ncbi:hypothetical protein GK047_02220 [Paenibacillus sp. SYP-B3998]|uniref:WD40 repeat domain-containing protein n=1 Tax=Paenibacillus sp. SYP-B3998 TaxID=2678564 RepID=A0A6G3ZT03_9BACL|nr:hypothetical protein [Paenibacillus sp. SYP-B3998]NEW04834.1 hypothetical protein [Paenibacillus sp. SYP-B3998]